MTDTWTDDFSQEEAELAHLLMRPGLRVFVGKREGNRARTAVMAGRSDVPWFRAINCVGANHAERAQGYVERYYAAHGKRGKSDAVHKEAE